MLLSWHQTAIGGPSPVVAKPPIFLYDPATNKDLITNTVVGVLKASTTVDSTLLIDEHPTIKLASNTAGVTITFPTPMNFEAMSEWTIEWSSHPTNIGALYYCEMMMDITAGSNFPIGCRWTNSGYGDRLQFNMAEWTNPNLWRPPATKATVINQDVRWAIVYTNSRFTIYKDGIKQTLANSTNTGPGSVTYFNKTHAIPIMNKLFIGYYNGTNQSFLGNVGRVRISDYARYINDYTPAPF